MYCMQEIKRWLHVHKSRVLLLAILAMVVAIVSPTFFERVYQCRSTAQVVFVQGSSMQGIVSGGDSVTADYDYFRCHPVERDNLVLFSFSGNPNPLLKIIKGLPGDHWNLQKGEGGTNIVVNGVPLRNAQGLLYTIDARKTNFLNMYVHDYKGVIPPHAYLLLGNLPAGSMDSTQFGLVDEKQLIARVSLPKKN